VINTLLTTTPRDDREHPAVACTRMSEGVAVRVQLFTGTLCCTMKFSKSGELKKLVGCTRCRLRAMARGFRGAGGQNATSTSGILCSFDLGVVGVSNCASGSKLTVFNSFRELPGEEVVVAILPGHRMGRQTQLSRERRRLPTPISTDSVCNLVQTVVGAIARM